MTRSPIFTTIFAGSAMALLSACGGGGSGVASTPDPIGTPGPTPISGPVRPPIPAGPIGLESDQPFKTYGAWADGWGQIWSEPDAVEISYSPSDEKYTIRLPSEEPEGTLQPKGGTGSFDSSGWISLKSTVNDVIIGDGPEKLIATVSLDWPASSPYSYTNFGLWYGARSFGEDFGVFAYGIPTLADDIPSSGSASYSGEIRGLTNGEPLTAGGSIGPLLQVYGSVNLSFDFGAGTLSGKMEPWIAPVWDAIPLGIYTFRDTVYSTGSSTFSGAFAIDGAPVDSFFSGSFTGPQAAELMANWKAPFQYPGTDAWGTMAGVWIAKRGN